ncbi:MAG: tetratricopeptide repeat protein [Alphaproteobacteria bacterium]|nr:tetratricopeptide repeat protein [Alphaproteobacteria bacterium]
MTLKDMRDVPVSTGNATSLACLEQATELFLGYFNDPIAVIDAALAEDPGFVMGHCFRAGVLATTTDKALVPELEKSVAAAKALSAKANDRERRHMAAAEAWLHGDFRRSVALYGDILIDYPRDVAALQLAHLGDFYLGQSMMLRDRVARVLPDWDASTPGYGYVMGMHAFGLEETGDYGRAEERARVALAMNRRDPWAVHAGAHVMEMQGRLADGIEWLGSRAPDWSHDNGFAFHNWWHLALYRLDLGQVERVLELYDTAIRPKRSDVVLEMIDAAAMLWRLHLRGIELKQRWDELAESWAPRAGEAYYAFNDAHAMMTLVASGREREADRLLANVVASAAGSGTNAMMAREVGVPVCRALHAFGRGDYDTAIDLLMPVRAIAHRFGGSHAQRDLLSLTLIEAALRAGRGRLARALLAERTELKPASPFAWAMTARALDAAGDRPAAARARRTAEGLAGSMGMPRPRVGRLSAAQ